MQRVCNYERMNVERIFARILAVVIGAFWILAVTVGSPTQFSGTPLASFAMVLIPLGFLVAVFVLGLFYETAAAWLLFAGAGLSAMWGLAANWEAGSWAMMGVVLIAPLVVAGLLYLLAARAQTVCELEERGGASRPAAGHA
jgi:hypothetical protein